jgi:hypothetical protein
LVAFAHKPDGVTVPTTCDVVIRNGDTANNAGRDIKTQATDCQILNHTALIDSIAKIDQGCIIDCQMGASRVELRAVIKKSGGSDLIGSSFTPVVIQHNIAKATNCDVIAHIETETVLPRLVAAVSGSARQASRVRLVDWSVTATGALAGSSAFSRAVFEFVATQAAASSAPLEYAVVNGVGSWTTAAIGYTFGSGADLLHFTSTVEDNKQRMASTSSTWCINPTDGGSRIGRHKMKWRNNDGINTDVPNGFRWEWADLLSGTELSIDLTGTYTTANLPSWGSTGWAHITARPWLQTNNQIHIWRYGATVIQFYTQTTGGEWITIS